MIKKIVVLKCLFVFYSGYSVQEYPLTEIPEELIEDFIHVAKLKLVLCIILFFINSTFVDFY